MIVSPLPRNTWNRANWITHSLSFEQPLTSIDYVPNARLASNVGWFVGYPVTGSVVFLVVGLESESSRFMLQDTISISANDLRTTLALGCSKNEKVSEVWRSMAHSRGPSMVRYARARSRSGPKKGTSQPALRRGLSVPMRYAD